MNRTPTLNQYFEDLGFRVPEDDLRALRLLTELALPRYPVRRPWLVVDIGSWTGRTALCALRTALRISNRDGRIYCLDTWLGGEDGSREIVERVTPQGVFRAFCQNVGKHLLDRIIPLDGSSQHWAEHWPRDLRADLILLDCHTSYEGTREDVDLWLPKLHRGGILCGRHYGHSDGVTRAVDEVGRDGLLGTGVWWKHAGAIGTQGTG